MVAQVTSNEGLLRDIQERKQFARSRFGHYYLSTPWLDQQLQGQLGPEAKLSSQEYVPFDLVPDRLPSLQQVHAGTDSEDARANSWLGYRRRTGY